jgi:hypothetical protein
MSPTRKSLHIKIIEQNFIMRQSEIYHFDGDFIFRSTQCNKKQQLVNLNFKLFI